MKLFHLERKVDSTGISGTGNVACGVVFDDGAVALHWNGEHPSTNIYKSVDDLIFIHGHNGNTIVVWD